VIADYFQDFIAFDCAIKFITVEDEKLQTLLADMQFLFFYFDTAEMNADVVPKQFVVVTGNVHHFGAFFRFSKNLAQHVVMRLRPKDAFFHAPDVNDIANKIKVFGVSVL
jgi:hypothetical protein